MQALTTAIEMERWDVAALLMLHALLRVTAMVPPDAVHGLLEALEGDDHASRRV